MKLVKNVRKMLEVLAIKIATEDANTTCACITYQPKLPKAIKKVK